MDFSFEQDLVLENERVLLKPLEQGDVSNLLEVASEGPELVKYSPILIHTEALLDTYIREALQERADGKRYPFSIFDRQKETYAGTTSFGNFSHVSKVLEVGWTWIGSKFQRTGLNRNCKFLMFQYTFETLEFERLEFRIDKRNLQSRTAVEAIGAKYEGLHRSDILMTDGTRRDTCYYSILRSEWPDLKQLF